MTLRDDSRSVGVTSSSRFRGGNGRFKGLPGGTQAALAAHLGRPVPEAADGHQLYRVNYRLPHPEVFTGQDRD